MPGVTRCQNADLGGVEAELPTDALKAWGAHGWEPITGESRSREEAEAQDVAAANAAAADVTEARVSEALKTFVGVDPASTDAVPPQDPGSPAGDAGTTGTTAGDAGTNDKGEVNNV